MHLLEVVAWVKSKFSISLVFKKGAFVLIYGFCNVPLISLFVIGFQFEFDGNLNPWKCQLLLCLDALFYYWRGCGRAVIQVMFFLLPCVHYCCPLKVGPTLFPWVRQNLSNTRKALFDQLTFSNKHMSKGPWSMRLVVNSEYLNRNLSFTQVELECV